MIAKRDNKIDTFKNGKGRANINDDNILDCVEMDVDF